MSERYDVKFNPRLKPFVEEALKNQQVKAMLAFYHLNEDKQGLARLALTLFLEDMGVAPALAGKRSDNKKG